MTLVWKLLVLTLAVFVESKEFYIATSTSFCPNSSQCFTLDQLAQANLPVSTPNLTLTILPGEHTLTRLFSIHNMTRVKIIGQTASQINIYWDGHFQFSHIDQLSIKWVNFNGHKMAGSIDIFNIRNIRYLFIGSCYFVNLNTGNISNSTNVVIENAVFRDNSDTALKICGAVNAFIKNSLFIQNRGLFGGAIYIDAVSKVTLNNSTFSSNRAEVGGAVYTLGEVSISNSTFTNNNAVYQSRSMGSKCNVWKAAGGGIFVESGSMSVIDTQLRGNSADYGGGINVCRGDASISNSIFTSNTASRSGGGIDVHLANACIRNSTFTLNAAVERGGGINVLSSNVFVSNSNLISNKAIIGGGIGIYRGNAFIMNTTLMGNHAKFGGGINVYGNACIVNSSLTANTATRNGGGIDLWTDDDWSSSVSMSESRLIGNTAVYGGGIEVYQVYNTELGDGRNAVSSQGFVSLSNRCCTNNAHSACTGVFQATLAYKCAGFDGEIAAWSGSVFISNDNLINNNVATYGGGIHLYKGIAFISKSTLTGNNATESGGAVSVHKGITSIFNSTITDNMAHYNGGGINADSCIMLEIHHTVLSHNTAYWGGGISVRRSHGSTYITHSTLTSNIAAFGGGIAAFLESMSVLHSKFMNNRAVELGSAVYGASLSSVDFAFANVRSNSAGVSSIHFMACQNVTFSDSTISNNNGCIYFMYSAAYFEGQTIIDNNYGATEGGAICAEQSQIFFNNETTITNNTALEKGGGIYLMESSLFVASPLVLLNNTANNGGGIFAYHSTIKFFNATNNVSIAHNYANFNGGGIYVIGSVTTIRSYISIEFNKAEANGGGLYLQQDSRVVILKDTIDAPTRPDTKLTISDNTAQRGGGIYVDDSTASDGACLSGSVFKSYLGECFIQTFLLYPDGNVGNTVNTIIKHNRAIESGSAIYGGLLDRCLTLNDLSEVKNTSSGIEYFNRTVELPVDTHSISSDPLQVILCDTSPKVLVRKGHSFRLSVKALDQIGSPVNATIHSTVITKSGVGRLKEGQVEQQVGSRCTQLEYNVFSQDNSAQLELYAEGPCNDLGLSRLTINITFLECTCPLGFHSSHDQSDIECSCECDSQLQATECFPDQEAFLLDNTLWIGAAASVINCNDTGYLTHKCPFDYCVDEPVIISINSSQQINKQCAYNRSGELCGECEEGLSLVFASSKCRECSSLFLFLLLPFAIAGVLLVLFILWLNMTVANGNIYGLIFYTNVLTASKDLFIPFKVSNFLTVFVSWVNLNLGIETCFYNGMSSQAKVLLQIVFPAYLFFLIFLIIILSNCIDSFAKVLSNRNPVAALCTLLILSYSKLLRLIIAALQFTVLECPDDSYTVVWLYDANVQYFTPSHIPRFVAAAVILTACVLFTTLLFFGQWFPLCSKWKVMKWTKNTKYIGFMDAFHAPFTPRHRYWVGMLLFGLIVNNIVASMAPDTTIPVLSAGCIAAGLIVYKSLLNRVHKNRLTDLFETLYLMNIVLVALATLANVGQLVLGYVSMSVAFIVFIVIVCYHFYLYVIKKTNIWNDRVRSLNPTQRISRSPYFQYQRLASIDDNANFELPDIYSSRTDPVEQIDDSDKYITPPIITLATRPDQLREPDLDILAPVTTDDYRQALPVTQAANRPRPVISSTIVEQF